MAINNLTNKKFGRLTVISVGEKRRYKSRTRIYWKCKCDCGNTKLVRSDNLTSGLTISCGCYKNEVFEKKNRIKGTHLKTKTRLHNIWVNMKARCRNSNSTSYEDYGGRGIAVCEKWENSFESFYDWSMNNGYRENLSIDRIDNNKDYCPENCRWSDVYKQCNNKRNNVWAEINGSKKTLAEWSRYTGINYDTIRSRYKNGKRGSDLIIEPKRRVKV